MEEEPERQMKDKEINSGTLILEKIHILTFIVLRAMFDAIKMRIIWICLRKVRVSCHAPN